MGTVDLTNGATGPSPNSLDLPHSSILGSIPPIQTQPYSLVTNPNALGNASWDETLLVDEELARLVELDALLLFEVLQLPTSFHSQAAYPEMFGTIGVCRLGWGFLRPAGPRLQQQHNLKVPFGQLPGDTPPELQTDYGLTGYGSGTGLGPEAASKRTPLLGYQRLQLYEYKAPPYAYLYEKGGRRKHKAANSPVHAFWSWQVLMGRLGDMGIARARPSLRREGCLHVNVIPTARPPPATIKTDPGKQIRPNLPAGYGSGFEEGSMPIDEFLRKTFGTYLAAKMGGGLMVPSSAASPQMTAFKSQRAAL